MDLENFPKTLHEVVRHFDADKAHDFFVSLRWPEGVSCPRCGSGRVSFISTRKVWTCMDCKTQKQFSVKVGTIFEGSPIKLDKWFAAMWMLTNAKNGISSYEIHRALGVTQKTAWFMMHRIRVAMQTGSFVKSKLGGIVEVDESYIGGLARNMHKHTKERRGITGNGREGKDCRSRAAGASWQRQIKGCGRSRRAYPWRASEREGSALRFEGLGNSHRCASRLSRAGRRVHAQGR